MFAPERLRIIKGFISSNKKADVHSLSDTLNVSEVTIRRDLEKLESEGFLIRTHGGAILNEEDHIKVDLDTAEMESIFDHDCDEIATIAYHMIQDFDVIMLTNGKINNYLAKKLSSKNNVTVLTNDLLIALRLSSYASIKVVLLGGDIDFNSKSVFGALTISNIQKFFVNKIFIEIEGVTEQMNFTTSSPEKAALIQSAASNATEKIILCTASAFNKASFYTVGNLKMANKIITNSNISDEQKNFIFSNNINLYTSINIFEGSI